MLAFAVGGVQDAAWVVTDRRGRVARSLEGPASGKASFGPDGAVVFQRVFGSTSEIWLTPGGDAPPVRLLGGDAYLYRDPAVSPDGKVLACAVADDPDSRTHLALVELDTGRRIDLPSAAKCGDANPIWEAGGEALIFETTQSDHRALFRLHLADNRLTRLTPETEVACRPASVAPGVLLYQSVGGGERPQLMLCDYGSKDGDPHTHPLRTDEEDRLRCDPAVHVGKNGKVRIAFAAMKDQAELTGEPPRFDVYVAQLAGLPK